MAKISKIINPIIYIGDKRYRWVDPFAITPELAEIISYANKNGFALPSNTTALNKLILDMKSAGIWQKLDVFYVFSGDGSTGFKLINMINPNNHYATAYGGLTWGNDGVKGNGSNGYINTNYNPSTSGINYTLNSASILSVVGAMPTAPFAFTAQGGDAGRFNQFANYFGNAMRINVASGSVNVTNVDMSGSGLMLMSRTSSNDLLFVNNTNSFDRTQSSAFVRNDAQRVLQAGGTSSTHLMYCFGMGASISFAESQAFRTAFNNYLTSIGEMAL